MGSTLTSVCLEPLHEGWHDGNASVGTACVMTFYKPFILSDIRI